MQLDLNHEDCEVLIEVLTTYLSELRFEVGNTDDHDYRNKLKAREASLSGILGRLEEAGYG